MSFVHFIELLLVVGILIAVGIPLFGKLSQEKLLSSPDELEEEYKHLLVRKEEVLISIKELEFDLKTDKVSGADYEDLRKDLEEEAVSILERLDQLETEKKKGKSFSKHANLV
ncbi:MAG: hypothetical protein V3U37_05475 [Nitrospinaceae bacterium]